MNKYGAKKIIIDGIEFDSKKEGRRYQQLKILERAGKIKDLELQKKFEIVDGGKYYEVEGRTKKNRKRYYKADFYYKELKDGRLMEVVEDVKGSKQGAAYQLYSLKRDIILSEYDVYFRET